MMKKGFLLAALVLINSLTFAGSTDTSNVSKFAVRAVPNKTDPNSITASNAKVTPNPLSNKIADITQNNINQLKTELKNDAAPQTNENSKK